MAGKADHFKHDFIVRLRPFGAGIPHKNGIAEVRAVDLHVAATAAFEIGSHKCVGRPLQNLFHASPHTIPVPALSFEQLDDRFIAGQRIPQVFGGNVDVFLELGRLGVLN